MKDHLCFPTKSQIAYEILAYVKEHPGAQDTLEGIVRWWLLERKINYQTNMVKEAVTELVGKGLLLEYKGCDSRIHYRTNRSKSREIIAFIDEGPE